MAEPTWTKKTPAEMRLEELQEARSAFAGMFGEVSSAISALDSKRQRIEGGIGSLDAEIAARFGQDPPQSAAQHAGWPDLGELSL